jgi:hypothetical protein
LLMGRWYAMRRAQAIRAIEKKHDTRVKYSTRGSCQLWLEEL